jgi:hypothetical protein
MSRTPFFPTFALVACVLGGCARPASQPLAAQPIAAHPIIDYVVPVHEAREVWSSRSEAAPVQPPVRVVSFGHPGLAR